MLFACNANTIWSNMDISKWLTEITSPEWTVFIKRLSANDTGATKSHQSGVYVPENVINTVLPELDSQVTLNPDYLFPCKVESHDCNEQVLRAIYYNNRHFSGTRNEKRITRWKSGTGYNPVQDVESTGSLALFAFHCFDKKNTDYLKVWICRSPEEEEVIENVVGEVIPGLWLMVNAHDSFSPYCNSIDYSETINFPDEWKRNFPTGEKISDYISTQNPLNHLDPDRLIIEWRKKEFSLFSEIENYHIRGKILEFINTNYNNISTEKFISLANSVLNRRKARSGRSLELILEKIFNRTGLHDFSTQAITEGNKRPDFIFPSIEKYHDKNYPDSKLRMLAVKTTCKDRWRQILNEADRLVGKTHLFTLQEGVSVNQFNEMKQSGVSLVVPAGLHIKFPAEIREQLFSLATFIEDTKLSIKH